MKVYMNFRLVFCIPVTLQIHGIMSRKCGMAHGFPVYVLLRKVGEYVLSSSDDNTFFPNEPIKKI